MRMTDYEVAKICKDVHSVAEDLNSVLVARAFDFRVGLFALAETLARGLQQASRDPAHREHNLELVLKYVRGCIVAGDDLELVLRKKQEADDGPDA